MAAKSVNLIIFLVLFVVYCAIFPLPLTATQIQFDIKEHISGVEVQSNVTFDVDTSNSSEKFSFVASADLSDLVAKIDNIVKASGLDRPKLPLREFEYKGTLLAVEGDRLRVKYHFRGEVNKSIKSNGSVEFWLLPVVEANTARLTIKDTRLNISNDIVMELLRVTNIDKHVASKLNLELNTALESPEARLRLPEILLAANTTMKTVKFSLRNGTPNLELTGDFKFTLPLIPKFLDWLMKR